MRAPFWLSTAFWLFIGMYDDAQAACSWEEEDGLLNMCDLSTQTIDCEYDSENHNTKYYLKYSPFRDALTCDSTQAMFQQTSSTSTNCIYLSLSDDGVTPIPYSGDLYPPGGEAWQFVYSNGQKSGTCFEPRVGDIIFACKEGVVPYHVVSCAEEAQCKYDIVIESQYACAGNAPSPSSSSDDSGMGGGWIFVIILISAFAAYFLIGYAICGFQNNKNYGDIKGSCPHCGFWLALPQLVMTGCLVTKEAIMNLAGRGGGGSGDALIDDDDDE